MGQRLNFLSLGTINEYEPTFKVILETSCGFIEPFLINRMMVFRIKMFLLSWSMKFQYRTLTVSPDTKDSLEWNDEYLIRQKNQKWPIKFDEMFKILN